MELLFRKDNNENFFYFSSPFYNKFLCFVISSRVLGSSNLGALIAWCIPGIVGSDYYMKKPCIFFKN
jgi:hypothetical protein